MVRSAAVAALVALIATAAAARDLGQWKRAESAAREWYARQMQPDNPNVSCCGTADAYWADTYAQEGDQFVAIITDDRDDAPLLRPHIDPGTRVVVPNNKLKFGSSDPNPTGHGIIFIGAGGHVYCYLPPSGS